jgi:zinc and cadmium transporter
MIRSLIYALLAVFVVSLTSFIWLLTFWIKNDKLEKVLIYLVAFSAWALLWDVFFHLLPELSESDIDREKIWILIIWWIVIWLFIEKVIHRNHCHHMESREHHHPLATMNLVWDFFHNFTDWLIIWASFLISIPAWISTSIAVLLHEIPQEIGDFAVLIHWWYKKSKALLMNFVVALSSIIWVLVTFLIWNNVENLELYLTPIAIGMFIYIAWSDLIPEINKHNQQLSKSLLQIFMFILGSALMYSLLFLE